ncbi:MAG: oxygenase MpaB family protein [Bacteroidota bacterium]
MNHHFKAIPLSKTERQQQAEKQLVFERQIQALERSISCKAHGFFGPQSMTWTIYREPSLLLGGVSALLLQIAHPAIAEGVRQFSNFHQAYLHRAHRTFMAMSHFYFGHTHTAMKTARHLHHMHGWIRGTVDRKVAGVTQKVPFCAQDAELLCWVLSTLVATSLQVYELMHPPLNRAQKHRFFEESKTLALLMGIPQQDYPTNYQAFEAYYANMLASDQLEIGTTALDLAQLILHPPYASQRLLKMMGGTFLPPTLAKAYRIELSMREQQMMQRLLKGSRYLLRLLPTSLRSAPPYHQAHYRVKKAAGKNPIHLGAVYDWLAQAVHFPFCIPPASSF